MHTPTRRLVGVLAVGGLRPHRPRLPPPPADAAGRHQHQARHHHHSSLMPIQLLSFNDFHGNLEPPSGSGGPTSSTTRCGPTRRPASSSRPT